MPTLKSSMNRTTHRQGFTLIELLVTMSIIGLLASIAIFGLRSAQVSGRDGRRKADLEQVRSGLELYRADCRRYPASLSWGGTLQGGGAGVPASCTGTYIQRVPQDASAPGRNYSYTYNSTSGAYKLCAALEDTPTVSFDVSGCNCGVACNYSITNP